MSGWNKTETSAFANKGAPLPSTPLADAMARGIQDAGRIGQAFKVGGQGTPTFESRLGFAYLKNLTPQLTQGRNIEIGADPVFSSQTTVVASYRPADQGERNNQPGIGDGTYLSTPLRDFRAQVTFGAGTSQVYCEMDISEGIAMSLPAQSLTLVVYSTHYSRYASTYTGQAELLCQVHLASGMATRPGQCTDRVYAPFQAAIDMLDPPTIEQWCADLKEALCDMAYVQPAPPVP